MIFCHTYRRAGDTRPTRFVGKMPEVLDIYTTGRGRYVREVCGGLAFIIDWRPRAMGQVLIVLIRLDYLLFTYKSSQ